MIRARRTQQGGQSLPPANASWAFVAATSKVAAERFARANGIEPQLIFTGAEFLAAPLRFVRLLRSKNVDVLALHSRAWQRQPCPHAYELVLSLAPGRDRYVIDEETGLLHRFGFPDLARRTALLPAEIAAGVGSAGRELSRHVWRRARGGRAAGPRGVPDDPPGAGRSLLAVWPGSWEPVGGAVTHISGILGAFRRLGFEVVVLTTVPPPPQLQSTAHRVEVAEAPPRGSRLTRTLSKLSVNDGLRRAGLALAREHRPQFVYQRHDYLLTAGADIARATGVPLVLEWNSSQVWAHDHWVTRGALDRLSAPLVRALAVAFEAHVLGSADIVAAVSDAAAAMASERGARPSHVTVVPNGVNLDVIPPPRSGEDQRGRRLIGWIGSFGRWHGADVLIRALPFLPPEIEAVLIGDGDERYACMALARSLRVDDRVEWTGALTHASALARLAECDVLVSPHLPVPDAPFFFSPIKIFEYMALGKPIVASRLEQLGRILEDGRTARLVTPGDAQELADAVLELIRSPDRARMLGLAARREAEERHTWDHRASAILDRLRGPSDDNSGSAASSPGMSPTPRREPCVS
jgi:glycosyltransferase involved in cell wall biosynthesis